MKTEFYELHKTRGAHFTRYQGWELPQRFVDPMVEYEAVRKAVGVIDVGYRTTFRLSGPDRVEFLHRIVSNDIKRLSPGAGCQAVFLTAKGKIVAAMKVVAAEGALLIEVEPSARQPLLGKLEMYKLMQKVDVDDVTGAVAKVLLQGPKSTELLRRVIGQDVSLADELQHQEFQVGGGRLGEGKSGEVEGGGERRLPFPLRVIQTQETGEVGYELMAPGAQASRLWELLARAGGTFGLEPVGFQAFNMLRVEAGIPWQGVDMDDTNFPQEVRLDHALDWEKGCYTGYEPVARIKFRGHVNRRLMGLVLKGQGPPAPTTRGVISLSPPPASGSRVIKDDQAIGRVTTAVYSPHLNVPIALASVRREFCEPGTEVVVEAAEGRTQAVVAELPFYERRVE